MASSELTFDTTFLSAMASGYDVSTCSGLWHGKGAQTILMVPYNNF
jgi:hypothetical protein